MLRVFLGWQTSRSLHMAKHHDAAVIVWRTAEFGHDRVGEELSAGGGMPCDQIAELVEPFANVGSTPFDHSVSNEDEPLGRRNLIAIYFGLADHLGPEGRVVGEAEPGRRSTPKVSGGMWPAEDHDRLPSLVSSDP